MSEEYNSRWTGEQIDGAIGDVRENKETWNGKQNALTFDNTPTEKSTNPVTSGGVKTALDGKQAKGNYAAASIAVTATLTVAGWVESDDVYTQIVSVTGVTASNNIIVTAAPANFTEWGAAGIYASAQGAGALTFTCLVVPEVEITANILIVG